MDFETLKNDAEDHFQDVWDKLVESGVDLRAILAITDGDHNAAILVDYMKQFFITGYVRAATSGALGKIIVPEA